MWVMITQKPQLSTQRGYMPFWKQKVLILKTKIFQHANNFMRFLNSQNQDNCKSNTWAYRGHSYSNHHKSCHLQIVITHLSKGFLGLGEMREKCILKCLYDYRPRHMLIMYFFNPENALFSFLSWRLEWGWVGEHLGKSAEDEKTELMREQKRLSCKKWDGCIMSNEWLLRVLLMARDNLGLDLKHSNCSTVTKI